MRETMNYDMIDSDNIQFKDLEDEEEKGLKEEIPFDQEDNVSVQSLQELQKTM